MFDTLEMAPPDPIFGILEAFRADPNPDKINLAIGVYKDAEGNTPILQCVKNAEKQIFESETSKGYLPISGAPEYARVVQELLFGETHEIVTSSCAATVHTPGGTGALRVAGDFIKHNLPQKKIWLSKPTWANHPKVFKEVGLEIDEYLYFDTAKNAIDFDAMLTALQNIPEGDVVLLHGCCHNPTGMDPNLEQWGKIADVVQSRNLLPLVDFAYQGFSKGLEEDTKGLRAMCHPGQELIVANSFSKNFGLYNERVGALTIVTNNDESAEKVLSNIKVRIRTNYSNPPAHGAAIVNTVLNDPNLRAQWVDELSAMRARINGMRELFVTTLKEKGVQRDFSFVTDQSGMFSFSGLRKDQIARLRERNSIYMVGSGRINFAGMTDDNMSQICDAITTVL